MIRRLCNSVARLEESANLHDETMADLGAVVASETSATRRAIQQAASRHGDAMEWIATAAIASYLVFAMYLVARHMRESRAGT